MNERIVGVASSLGGIGFVLSNGISLVLGGSLFSYLDS